MEQDIKGNGRIINKRENARKVGQMVLFMKENIKLEKNQEKVNLIGLMGLLMKEILKNIK